MDALRALITEHASLALAVGGALIGLVFGAMAQHTGFCTLGALSDWTLFGDTRRLRAWVLAIAIALAGTQGLFALGVTNLDQSIYRSGPLLLGGHLAGGLMFGFGMVLTGGCVSRNLIRAGAGDLRALLVLVVTGIVVAMALGGILGSLRVAFTTATSIADPSPLSASTGVITGGILATALSAYCFADADFRSSRVHKLSGLIAGLCVVAGWALTGLAFDEFADAPVTAQSLTFVKPVSDTLEWLKRSTALGAPGFAVMTVAGTVAGSLIAALLSRTFVLATFADARDTLRHLTGAVLMGIGGVLALGCSIGQGITGVSTLSPGSVLSLAAIALGALAGLKAAERYSIFT
jgi:uncharacterized membrane protein YedE/YeeE